MKKWTALLLSVTFLALFVSNTTSVKSESHPQVVAYEAPEGHPIQPPV
ncbi:hypothetical protein [Bacillus sp. USDA818B3_A]|nr:hypothetical protein [Bacillus sp. USDA818B3_A]